MDVAAVETGGGAEEGDAAVTKCDAGAGNCKQRDAEVLAAAGRRGAKRRMQTKAVRNDNCKMVLRGRAKRNRNTAA